MQITKFLRIGISQGAGNYERMVQCSMVSCGLNLNPPGSMRGHKAPAVNLPGAFLLPEQGALSRRRRYGPAVHVDLYGLTVTVGWEDIAGITVDPDDRVDAADRSGT
jgi:hypothetical protein